VSPAEEAETAKQRRRRRLRTGFTTGACAAAATAAACLALRGEHASTVTIPLPAGFKASFDVEGIWTNDRQAGAWVVKDAGDDPDVTHGARIGVEVELGRPRMRAGQSWAVTEPGLVARRLAGGAVLELRAGTGVGTVTRPGLGIPVGGPAINPVPRRMIARAVREALGEPLPSVRVTVSVQDGERLARRTLNGRLGILGGLSILGTTGVVRPYSTAAWRASVLQGMEVAAAAGCVEVVACTGGRSEAYARALRPDLPEVAFIEMGEFTGPILRRACELDLEVVTLAGMIGKLSKVACGHLMTHAAGNQVDLDYLAKVCLRAGGPHELAEAISQANTARHVQELVQAADLRRFFDLIADDARRACRERIGARPRVQVLLFDFDGELLGRAVDVA
jgi:cobalt-precorrin-5B (C1)-methyltransferase